MENSITEIKIGEQVLPLAELPVGIQNLVGHYEYSVSKLKQAERDLIVANASTRALYNEVLANVDAWLKEKAQETIADDSSAPADEVAEEATVDDGVVA